jgi:hypothetical protein
VNTASGYTPSRWQTASLVAFVTIIGLADALLVSWWIGNAWGMALSAGAIAGLMLFIAWALRRG